MKYEPSNQTVPSDKRKEYNEKILYLIDNNQADEFGITGADIYNLYTGDGGLHGLKRGDYANDASYSKAKKEIENGQFFTPPELCRTVAEMLEPSVSALIADLTCGMGNFFNFLPTESNLYGCELDAKAYKVAKHLYPNREPMFLRAEDSFNFTCNQCGKCCRNREDVLLTGPDIYRASKLLGMTADAFVETYCEMYIGDSSRIPICRLKPQGEDRHCPLLREN